VRVGGAHVLALNVTRASIVSDMVLNLGTRSADAKCANIPRAIARHSASLRRGKADWRFRMARRRCGRSNQ
jgi:hypothetical protein